MANLDVKQIDELINNYLDKGGDFLQVEEGVLRHGFFILHDFRGKLKTIISKEFFINSWTSGQSVRTYNKTPKKYQKIIDDLT